MIAFAISHECSYNTRWQIYVKGVYMYRKKKKISDQFIMTKTREDKQLSNLRKILDAMPDGTY